MIGKRLLVVDDEIDICDFVAAVAEDLGFETAQVTTHEEAKHRYKEFEPTLIVMDLAMPDGDGIELLRFLNAERNQSKILLISGFDKKVLSTAMQLGKEQGLAMIGTLQKPILIDDLEAMLSVQTESTTEVTADDLAKAIEDEQLMAYFQPKLNLSTGIIEELEALVRWEHPVLGFLLPDKFLPMAQEAGLWSPLTHLMVKHACKQIREWESQGFEISVAVNIPPQMLTNLSLPDEIAAFTKEYGVANDRLVIEITESGVMEDPTVAMDILTRFRLKGFRLSVDDFGTGFSSLNHLYRMPFSELKIDRSFVMGMRRAAEARIIVQATTEMAHRLELTVCAEGVEDKEALDFLASIGCEKAQGYYISKPLPGHEVAGFLENRRDGDKREQEEEAG